MLIAAPANTSTLPEASHCFQLAGWYLFAMMVIVAVMPVYRNQQHKNKISKQRLLVMVLALRVTEYAEAFESTWREKQEQQRELSEQLESWRTAMESSNAILDSIAVCQDSSCSESSLCCSCFSRHVLSKASA